MARILLIEDKQQVRELLREILEQNGHEMIACKNGADGYGNIGTVEYFTSIANKGS